ncbi:hypothetical protein QBC39DRAFT_363989 [Podospora conica]|nr:hypothetical protein QBC39DRAFT_363989 [Schizothecium conicum]
MDPSPLGAAIVSHAYGYSGFKYVFGDIFEPVRMSIATGTITLLTSVDHANSTTTTTILVHASVYGAAPAELSVISNELSSLRTVLTDLQSNATLDILTTTTAATGPLQIQIRNILSHCRADVSRITAVISCIAAWNQAPPLSDYLLPVSDYLSQLVSLFASLHTHRTALRVAVDELFSLTSEPLAPTPAPLIHADTSIPIPAPSIRNDTPTPTPAPTIPDDTPTLGQLREELQRLRDEVDRIQSHSRGGGGGAGGVGEADGNANLVLRRYLDRASSYAESVFSVEDNRREEGPQGAVVPPGE